MSVAERFLRYISVWTTSSDETADRVPSTDRQLDLAKLLMNEMKLMGVSEVHMDKYGYVYGCIPATEGYEKVPSVAFLAHMDTSPSYSGKDVNPQIIRDYDAQDINLGSSGKKILVEEFPHLKEWKGRTLITTDGTTLLGADDKAGIAEIMTAVDEIMKEEMPHGKISIAFTVDEEIGGGAEYLDLARLGADYGFTVDGDLEGKISYENFNASSAVVSIQGVNVHPGSAKDIMVNSMQVAIDFHSMLPANARPECTEGYEGFYHLCEMSGNVDHSKLFYIIRDFDMNSFLEKEELMRKITRELNEKYGDCITLEISPNYNNMREMITPCEWIIDSAIKACEMAGVRPVIEPIRGGTDGANLSFRGLPCPNLGTGGSAFHGPMEHISLEGMQSVVCIIKNIVNSFSEKIS